MFCFLLMLATAVLSTSGASEDPLIVAFYEEGCPGCLQVEELLTALTSELPESAVSRYEISEPDAFSLLAALATAYEIESPTVPIVFVGDIAVIGAGRPQEFQLRNAIGDCIVHGCPSPFDRILTKRSVNRDLLRLGLFAVAFVLLWLWQI